MIKNLNNDARRELAMQLEELKQTIEDAVSEARAAVHDNWNSEYDHADAYIFRQIEEGCDNVNPYNSSIQTLIDTLLGNRGDSYIEPIEEMGEEWEDE